MRRRTCYREKNQESLDFNFEFTPEIMNNSSILIQTPLPP